MKFLPLVVMCIFLTGCVGDRSDLELFVTTTKAQHVAHIPPLKEPPRFEHFAYQAELMRSPFVPPSRELTEEVVDTSKDCLQPDLKRRKGRLETYPLDNLKMRGTLSEADTTWALVETNDGSVYRMGAGEYLGLFNGRISKVTSQNVEVVELIPDGSGCWSERTSNLELSGE
ncbi:MULTISPECIES: pilus assembly protein PilP [Shewanella]|uniref:Pilus assembly protein PilP n=1 Tax=Shewanella baltica (strain OS195) TaxID=399599 RepID=A9L697_SHEB9|nr:MULTISPECIES: pilus assembly protein PilP [Shewanella]MBO6227656.1 pilus assembly protein PilP [Shewanella sp.]ABS10203.1 Pilus assembly protein PilP [Shewanella baltica OS185]ABX51362.1 Pilus assembly protein PilP [Shewanella baltica OS195]ADT96364.1 Pilus assembly protein PilP [Shewanella baltica OS678]EHC07200.1 Pilus assembly protein PilP [Shewanella baltica OS625]